MQIKINKEKVGYSAIIKDFRITTQGDTLDELIVNIQEALALHNEDSKHKKIEELKEFSLVI